MSPARRIDRLHRMLLRRSDGRTRGRSGDSGNSLPASRARSFHRDCLPVRWGPAFVGCTGSHYSPTLEPYTYYGQPMHVSFWNEIKKGTPPPEALFLAKQAKYVRNIPH